MTSSQLGPRAAARSRAEAAASLCSSLGRAHQQSAVDEVARELCTVVVQCGTVRSSAELRDFLVIAATCCDIDEVRSSPQVAGLLRVHAALSSALTDVHSFLSSSIADVARWDVSWPAWRTLADALREKVFSRLLCPAWLHAAGTECFQAYADATKSLVMVITSCLLLLSQHGPAGTPCRGEQEQAHQAWALALGSLGDQAVCLANSADTPQPLRSFTLINIVWGQLLRLLVDMPAALRTGLLSTFQHVFCRAWAFLQVSALAPPLCLQHHCHRHNILLFSHPLVAAAPSPERGVRDVPSCPCPRSQDGNTGVVRTQWPPSTADS